MQNNDAEKRLFGLIGHNIGYSFSKTYFAEKFLKLNLTEHAYQNFDIASIEELREIVAANPQIKGLNVTIPYKEAVIPLLDKMSSTAKKIGAVNTIRITRSKTLKGYNTDWYGFKKSLKPLLLPRHRRALILGNGGATKAIIYALDQLGILHTIVSRTPEDGAIGYDLVNATTFDNHQIIINCTPIGTFPDIEEAPAIPYQYFSNRHIAFDLIYNPEQTKFLQNAAIRGAVIKNGYEMLVFQAEKAWRIWNR